MSTLLTVGWRSREPPLPACAVAARGAVARRLAARLLGAEDAQLTALRGVGAPEVLLVLGEAGQLPWVDGVCYLGLDPQAPALLLPTALAPEVPPALLERALLPLAHGPRPLAVLLDPPALIAAGGALPLDRRRLRPLAEGTG